MYSEKYKVYEHLTRAQLGTTILCLFLLSEGHRMTHNMCDILPIILNINQ